MKLIFNIAATLMSDESLLDIIDNESVGSQSTSTTFVNLHFNPVPLYAVFRKNNIWEFNPTMIEKVPAESLIPRGNMLHSLCQKKTYDISLSNSPYRGINIMSLLPTKSQRFIVEE
jgi:hypothetical protein